MRISSGASSGDQFGDRLVDVAAGSITHTARGGSSLADEFVQRVGAQRAFLDEGRWHRIHVKHDAFDGRSR